MVVLGLDSIRSFIKITPISHENDTAETNVNGTSVVSEGKNSRAEPEEESLIFPLERIQHVEAGKKPPSMLSQPNFDHLHPMKCFSISISEWDGSQKSFDFEVETPLERTTILSTLCDLLKQLRGNDLCTTRKEISVENAMMRRDVVQCTPKGEGLDTSLFAPSGESENSCPGSEAVRPNESISELAMPALDISPRTQEAQQLPITEDASSREKGKLATSCTRLSSSQLGAKDLPVKWCTGGMCAFGFRDMASTFNEIFYSTDEHSATYHPCGRCSVLHGACTCADDSSKQQFMESYNTKVCSQPGMISLLEDHMWSDEDSSDCELYGDKNYMKVNDKFRNRAAVWNGQAQRVEQLRTKMTFATVERPKKYAFLQTTMSSDDAEQSNSRVNEKFESKRVNRSVAPENTSSVLLLHQLLGHAIPNDTEIKSKDEVLYYDSDPGDIKPRNHKRRPRRAMAARQNKVEIAQTVMSSTILAQSHELSMMRTKTNAINQSFMQEMIEVSQCLISSFFPIIETSQNYLIFS